jgi:IS5 family transposase
MHQTSKGKQWYFGMKAHVGVDSRTKLVHTVLAAISAFIPTPQSADFNRRCCSS